ncbi:hypothetical protein BDK61_2673 [Haloarcula quadrata]|uniref:Baseplate protein J-like barrel domain-containing protein n=1 Tax=Haloarcula quadrata TaxID=182779 RepID=A0A495R7Z4_9EURY|nr:baseplate J/gp47 family protein [Haloarcula quadrata]RKS83330.1 hypothetical protein BDK61_2673 [Haloarcula quadrata]
MSNNYGIQDDGSFRRKHIDDIRGDQKQHFKNEVGEDIELRQASPQMQALDMNALELARLWEVAESIYYASYYEDSFGEQLDKQLALAGFSRIPARSATGEVVFLRDSPAPEDITIPSGTMVTTQRTETKPRIPFETTEGVVLSAGNSEATAPIEALKPWQTELDEEWLGAETNVAAHTIERFEDLVADVDDVTNPNPTGDESLGYVEGRDRETDAEFKLRYQNSLADGGAATLRAVRSGVFNADDEIKSVGVDEVRDPDQGYGVQVTVLAPDVSDEVVAQAIVDSRAGGLESFGSESGIGTLEDGTEKTESFNRADEVTILLVADLTTSDTFPSDGSTQITDRIIRYIGGTASDNIGYPGLEIGEDVIYDQLFRRVMETQGTVMADLWIGTDDPDTAQTTDADDATVSDSSARGVRFEATADADDVLVEARLSANVADATQARLLDSNGNVLTSTDISDVAAGEWFRFDGVLSWTSGEAFDIAVDAEGASYTIGQDADPTYPYDGAAAGVDITQRYRGDLDPDGSPQATRPNVDGVRLNQVGESNISITDTQAAMTGISEVTVNVE